MKSEVHDHFGDNSKFFTLHTEMERWNQ